MKKELDETEKAFLLGVKTGESIRTSKYLITFAVGFFIGLLLNYFYL